MQNLSLEELYIERNKCLDEILKRISDLRSSKKVIEVCSKIFSKFPECNGIVLLGAYKGTRGDRFVYGFDEIEECSIESSWIDNLGGESLVTINSWISENKGKLDPETESLFEELSSIYPYPIEEEIDWNSMDLDSKFEIILLKNGEYYN